MAVVLAIGVAHYRFGTITIMVRRLHTASTHNCRRNVAGKHVRFREMILFSLTVGMVKVFGCRQACGNRPCTNRRSGGDGLWDFGFCPAVK
jgi:hypothetical protein